MSLIADSAHSITNGFLESGEAMNIICGIRGNCWFHCKKSIYKRLPRVKNEVKRKYLLASLSQLQVCQTPKIFKKASDLFVMECEKDDDDDLTMIH